MIYTTQNSQKAMYIGFPLHGHKNFGSGFRHHFPSRSDLKPSRNLIRNTDAVTFFFDAIFFQQDESKVVFSPSHSDTVSDFLILSSMKNLVG